MHLYEPIQDEEGIEKAVLLALRQTNRNERMVEAFVIAVWAKMRKAFA